MKRIFFRSNPTATIEIASALLVIVFGLVLRFRLYALNLTFWIDEAMLALNIVNRSFAGLMLPLDYDQGAPLGFLWLSKLTGVLLGYHEYSLRLLALLAGCFSMFALWRLSRLLKQPVGGVFALAIFVSSRYLVSYGVQVKQYAVDVAITLLLYLVGLAYQNKKLRGRDTWILALLGGAAVWLSHAAVFTLGGVGLVLIGTQAIQRNWRQALGYSLAAGFWALNFGWLYLVQYRSLASNSYLSDFWAEFFMPLSGSAPAWIADRLAGLYYNPGGISTDVPAGVLLVLCLGGMLALFWREKQWIWMFALSLVFTLAASSLDMYPFGGRMAMFAIPGLLLCAGEALELPRRWLSTRPVASWRAAGAAASVLLAGSLAFAPLAFSVEMLMRPKNTEHIAPTMRYLQSNYREGDVIYLYRMAIPAFRYYAAQYQLDQADVINGADFHEKREEYLNELDPLLGKKRVWLLFSHMTDYEYIDDRDFMLRYLNTAGDRKREFSDPGTAINLYLYDLAR